MLQNAARAKSFQIAQTEFATNLRLRDGEEEFQQSQRKNATVQRFELEYRTISTSDILPQEKISLLKKLLTQIDANDVPQ